MKLTFANEVMLRINEVALHANRAQANRLCAKMLLIFKRKCDIIFAKGGETAKMDNYDELLVQYTLNDQNYKKWRSEHKKVFGDFFASAFADQEDAQIHLTAALINISSRNFQEALPKLSLLESICFHEGDRAVVNFFTGLCHEMLENEEKMTEYYQKLEGFQLPSVIPLALRPYYRTAKFAQRNSECGKSIRYYQKALSFYDVNDTDQKNRAAIGQLIYDIATLFLYTHQYDKCESYLELSRKFDSGDNQHRTYVTSILYAVQGKREESQKLLGQLKPHKEVLYVRGIVTCFGHNTSLLYYTASLLPLTLP